MTDGRILRPFVSACRFHFGDQVAGRRLASKVELRFWLASRSPQLPVCSTAPYAEVLRNAPSKPRDRARQCPENGNALKILFVSRRMLRPVSYSSCKETVETFISVARTGVRKNEKATGSAIHMRPLADDRDAVSFRTQTCWPRQRHELLMVVVHKPFRLHVVVRTTGDLANFAHPAEVADEAARGRSLYRRCSPRRIPYAYCQYRGGHTGSQTSSRIPFCNETVAINHVSAVMRPPSLLHYLA